MSPRVSVVIPTYNRADILKETLASALKQTFSSFDIWVIDDGSTDHTKTVVSQFNGAVHYIYQENQERAAARNRGLRESKSTWVAFLDSDDLWPENHLEVMVKHLEKTPKAAFGFSDYCLIDGRNQKIQSIHLHPSLDHLFEELIQQNYICNSSTIIHREKVLEMGGLHEDRQCSGSEDWELWLRLSAKYPGVHVPGHEVMFRHHPDRTMIHAEPMQKSMQAVIDHIFKHPSTKIKLHSMNRNHILGHHHITYANLYAAQGDIPTAKKMLTKAQSLFPGICFQSKFIRAWAHVYLPQAWVKQLSRLKQKMGA